MIHDVIIDIASMEGNSPLEVVLACIEQLQIDDAITEDDQLELLGECLDYMTTNSLKNLILRKYGFSYDDIIQ